ncbi:MAG TPA: DUF3299 domain-containing protein [Pseudobdellovibrionaceae bacterium]|nr:DUF3299 domain-containing protein [Pseudobdellovibrionaceae bacterium]
MKPNDSFLDNLPKPVLYTLGLLIVLSIFLGARSFLNRNPLNPSQGAVEIDWNLLLNMDYVTGNVNSELKNLDGKFVRLPGFMIPFEDNLNQVTEFLLVPTPGACIHVPPPPPNQMVYVKLKKDEAVTGISDPIWVYGIIRLKNKTSVFGNASFEMEGTRIEPYHQK